MDINNILKGIKCSCGKVHLCDIENIYIESGAILKLKELCSQNKSILIVADENTYNAAGEKVLKVLSDKITKKVIFSGKSVLVPNEDAIENIQANLDGADLILGIGSGVIQDLCKYVSFFSKVPYIIVATAPSMDGYASTGAAMILKGMKETVPAGLPKAIVADVDVLKDAPLEMIKAGFGDIVGKYSALCDWRLSHIVNGEYICEFIYETTYEMIEKTLALSDGLLKRNEESIKSLTEALMIVGIMMSFAGSSRPASGSEHHLSHFFEIVGIVNSEAYFVHGIDVAYSGVITAKIREKILNAEFKDAQFRPKRDEYVKKMNDIYKSVSKGCIELQDKAGLYEAERAKIYIQKEKEIKDILKKMPKAKEIENMLARVGLYMEDFYKMYNEEKINDAIMYAKDLKDRWTVLWVNYDMFGNEERQEI